MKTKSIALLALMMLNLSMSISAKNMAVYEKEKSEVTYLVSMTCENCQKRIENTFSFEKGVTGLNVNLPQKTVTIEYRKDKTSPAKLKEAIQKLGYTVAPFRAVKEKEAHSKKD